MSPLFLIQSWNLPLLQIWHLALKISTLLEHGLKRKIQVLKSVLIFLFYKEEFDLLYSLSKITAEVCTNISQLLCWSYSGVFWNNQTQNLVQLPCVWTFARLCPLLPVLPNIEAGSSSGNGGIFCDGGRWSWERVWRSGSHGGWGKVEAWEAIPRSPEKGTWGQSQGRVQGYPQERGERLQAAGFTCGWPWVRQLFREDCRPQMLPSVFMTHTTDNTSSFMTLAEEP